ncbi:hypothetical protein [Silicimonas algicola]|uniref:hypothetical protein n=1 Tax=Silicimonas algicola TaxID=1826607 RepID=UPI0013DFD466|nr:hypothetical protein [Silicimonas algicola]
MRSRTGRRAPEATQSAFSTRTDALSLAYRQIIDQAEGVRRLGGQMQLVGMNAVIACANLGPQGLALKETALQLQTLAASAQTTHQALDRSLSRMEAGLLPISSGPRSRRRESGRDPGGRAGEDG